MASMAANPWDEQLDRSSCESDAEVQTPDEMFNRREENGIAYESRYFKDEEGNLCEEVTRSRCIVRRTRVSKTARDRISEMVPFGKELKVGTKAGQSARSPEVMDWTRDKTNTIVANDDENDYSLTCYGGGVDNNPLRRKANFLEELFEKLKETALLKPEDLEKGTTAAGARPGSGMGRAEPRRQIGGAQEDRTIRVSNLNEDIDEKHLDGLFKSLDKVPSKVKIEKLYIPKDEFTGKSRGFAFVTFADVKYAKMAIEKLNNHNFVNVVLSVEKAKPPKPKQ